ncbi:hypothetical protein ACFPOB_26205 [Bosea eneae]|uniref:Tail tape measure protein n=1 Tax=Bosea eneae TaxID=151454 RepID=A0ABW0IY26_9HYPH
MATSDLVVSVGANIQQLERQLKASARIAEQAADEIEAKFRKANPTLSGDFGLGVLKGAIAAISFDRITRGFVEANREIASFGDTARRVGLDLAKFQELRLAAQAQGVSGKEFDTGITGLAKKLNEARTEETELSKLFDANNAKLKTRTGEVISTNAALEVAADLISRAATEQDKVAIAEKFGLPPEFIPLLERGAAALGELARKAGEAGAILDSDVIAKAKQFDDAWNSAWASFASSSKAAIIGAAQGLSGLLSQAGAYLAKVDEANRKASQVPERAARRDQARDMALGNAGGRDTAEAARGAAAREARAQFITSEKDRSVAAPVPPARPTRGYMGSDATKVPPAKSGGGGGSSGKSEAEQAQDRLDRYVETLMRQNSVLDAEIATFGKSNAEKRAAVELAKAQVDLAKLDEGERQKVIASLTKEIELSEQKRTVLENLKTAQKGLADAQRFFGDAAVDALEDLIVNGAKAEDVVKRLAASLAKAALQAALMGTGPLAGLFGTAGVNGATGGLIGALFGRATGGPVNAGQPYRVGERGPETFVPTTPGKIIPAARGGFVDRRTFHIDARGAQQGVAEQITAALRAYDAGLPGKVMQTQAEARRRGAFG